MSSQFNTIALTGNDADSVVTESIALLARHILAQGAQVIVSDSIATEALPDAVRQMPNQLVAEEADLLISVGGDGSMLYAARQAAPGLPQPKKWACGRSGPSD